MRILFMANEQTYITVHQLLEENKSSTQFLQLLPLFYEQPQWVDALVDMAFSAEPHPFPQYASHLLLHVARKDASMLNTRYEDVVDGVLQTGNESVLRNTLGVLLCFPAGGYREGDLLDRLFTLLEHPRTKPGIINYSVHKIVQFLDLYPELEHEFNTLIQFREETGISPGIQAWLRTFRKSQKKRRKS